MIMVVNFIVVHNCRVQYLSMRYIKAFYVLPLTGDTIDASGYRTSVVKASLVISLSS